MKGVFYCQPCCSLIRCFFLVVFVGYFSRSFSSSFDLSNLPLDSCSAQLSSAQTSSTQQNSAQLSSTQLNSAQLNSAQLPSLFVRFWLVQSLIGLLVFSSGSVLFQTILSNARLDSSKLDEKGHIVVKSPTGIAGRNQLNSEFLMVFSPVPFCPVLTCPISYWTAGIFVCFCFIPNNSVQC